MKPPGGDWTAVIVLAVAGSIALVGAGFLGGYAVGYAQHKPTAAVSPSPVSSLAPTATTTASASPSTSATPSPTPSPSPSPSGPQMLPQCDYSDFPVYPGSVRGNPERPKDLAWVVDQSADQVASYFSRGAYQTNWKFQQARPGYNPWFFSFTRAPACRGTLEIISLSGSGPSAFYEVTTDAP